MNSVTKPEVAYKTADELLISAAELVGLAYYGWRCDEPGFSQVSTAFATLLGVEIERLEQAGGAALRVALCHPEDRQAVSELFASLSLQPREVQLDYRVIASDGHVRYLHERLTVVAPRAVGAKPTLLAVATDLTESHRLTRALHDTQWLAHVGHWRWSVQTNNLTECSPEYARLHGLSVDEICALPKNQHDDLIHPDDRERLTGEFLRFNEGERMLRSAYRIVRPDGQVRHVLMLGRCLHNEEGGVVEQYGIVQDVTELMEAEAKLSQANQELERRVRSRTVELVQTNLQLEAEVSERIRVEESLRSSESRYRSLYNQAPVAIWEEDWSVVKPAMVALAAKVGGDMKTYLQAHRSEAEALKRKVVLVESNRRTTELFGIPEKSSPGEFWSHGFATDGAFSAFVDVLCAFHVGKSRVEVSVWEKDYRSHPIFTHDVVFLPDQYRESWKRVVCVSQDVTERQRAADERDRLEAQLMQAQKMEAIGQLAGGIAHDFNNLLTSILGFTELAQAQTGHGDTLDRYLSEIQSAGERGRDLVSQMMTFSRNDVGGSEDVDLEITTTDVLRMMTPTLPSSMCLECDFGDDVERVQANPVQLHQVLVNLLINARDSMGGAGRVIIQTRAAAWVSGVCASCTRSYATRFVKICVEDDGPGVPAEAAGRIFEPFFTTKAVGRGTGMGLSVVHGIVHRSGGHITVETTRGMTRFSIFLPAASDQPAVASMAQESR